MELVLKQAQLVHLLLALRIALSSRTVGDVGITIIPRNAMGEWRRDLSQAVTVKQYTVHIA